MSDWIDLAKLALERLRLAGVTSSHAHDRGEGQSFTSASERILFPLFENGSLRPVIDCVFLDAALEAQTHMASNAHRGKLLPRP